ncbi:BCL5p [Stagonosporopsis vannaccii]|nr:BCL5p [Stagonosporopsis vannaccii]
MEALRRFLGASPSRPLPLRNESDDVYPVHMLDDTKTLRNIVVTWTLCFNDNLDADRLYVSLSNLLEVGDWRKVGGRLRLQDNGDLEIHVPRQFTAERPAVSFEHQSLAMDINEHPVGRMLPKSTNGPSIHPGPHEFRTFAVRKGAPETLEDYIYTDAPQLSLFVTTFKNATLVTLSWPHTLMDVMGQQALLHSWSLMLAGREAEVPPVLGARDDAIRAAADAPVETREDYSLLNKRLTGWAMAKFGMRFASDLVLNRSVETQTLFLPKGALDKLQRQAEADLATQKDDVTSPFISQGDVLTAWAIRAIAASLPQPRPVAALHALNARFRISCLKQSTGVYIQNMAVAAFALLSSDVATGPLGAIALENRRHLTEQSTEPQVLAYLRELCKDQKPATDPASTLYCDSDALLIPFTNWTRAQFFKTLDFSPAVVCAGETGPSRSNPPGTMIFHHAQSMRPNLTARNVIVVLGKDHNEDYWLTGTLLPSTWAKIKEDIDNMLEKP